MMVEIRDVGRLQFGGEVIHHLAAPVVVLIEYSCKLNSRMRVGTLAVALSDYLYASPSLR